MKSFFHETQGQTLIEYGLFLGVFVLVLVLGIPGLRNSVISVFAATTHDFTIIEGEVDPIEDPDPGEDPTEEGWFPPQLALDDDQTLYANGDIVLTGSAYINGNIVTNGNIDIRGGGSYIAGNLTIGGELIVPRYLQNNPPIQGELVEFNGYSYNFPLPVFPDITPDQFPNRGNFEAPWWPPVEEPITEDAYYPVFDIKKSVVIDTGNEGDVRTIVVDHFTTGGTGDVYLQGQGKLIIVINESFTFNGDSSFNPSGLPDSAIIYYRGSQDFNFGGAQSFTGNIYIEQADLNLRGSSSNAGNIIVGGDQVTVSGGTGPRLADSLLYAPLANLTLNGSSDLQGKVVANTVEINGASHVDFGPVQVSEDFYWDPFFIEE
jgi:Flp pilus assembly pilin Flp